MSYKNKLVSQAAVFIGCLCVSPFALADDSATYPSLGPLTTHSDVQRAKSLPAPTPSQNGADAKKVLLGTPSAAEVESLRKLNAVRGGTAKPLAIGFPRSLSEKVLLNHEALKWSTLPDGSQVAQVQITSTGAQAIRLGIRVDRIDAGVELRFWGSEQSLQAMGPVTSANVRTQDGIYWTPTTLGETVTLEIRLAAGVDTRGMEGEVVQLSHLMANPGAAITASIKAYLFTPTPQQASYCERDVACSNDTKMQQQANAVAQMLFMDGGSAYVCTGTLLNNARQDQTPYFLTAAHCISDQAAANTLNTWWFYTAATCGGPAWLISAPNLPNGAQLLYTDVSRDATLLRLNDTPPNGVIYSGWDSAPFRTGDAVVGIHHPGANPTKYAAGTVTSTTLNFYGSNDLTYSNFLRVAWDTGLAEEGSSGSGLFAAGSYALKGSLFGGPVGTQACGANTSSYSPFSSVYPAIRQFLSTPATHAVITPSVSGIATNTTISFQLAPVASDIGKLVNIYVGINFADGSWKLYDGARSTWVPLGAGPYAVFRTQTMTAQIGWDLFSNLDTTKLPHGMSYYIGYGVSDADLLSGKCGFLYEAP